MLKNSRNKLSDLMLIQRTSLLLAAICFNAPMAASADTFDSWIRDISGKLNYTVTQGSAHIFTDSSSPSYYPSMVAGTTDCQLSISVFGSCGGNNGSGAYVNIEPPVDNEFLDPCYYPRGATVCDVNAQGKDNIFTRTVTLPDGVTQTRVNPYYRLDNTQALITIITLPPQAAYLGVQTYLFSRQLNTGCVAVGIDPCRSTSFASIGDTINHISIADQSGLSWNGGTIALITTPNSTLYTNLANQFTASGGASSLIFKEPLGKAQAGNLPERQIPACDQPHTVSSPIWPPYFCAVVRNGLDTGASPATSTTDELNTIIRYSIPNDVGIASPTSPSEVWKQALAKNVRVYRVSAPNLASSVLFKDLSSAPIAGKLYNTEELESSSGAYAYPEAVAEFNATYVQPFLSAVLPAGATPIATAFAKSLALTPSQNPATDAGARPFQIFVGPACIAQAYTCLGDNQDTDSYMYITGLELYDTAVIVGVDSTNASVNNASYVGISLYSDDGFQNFLNSSLSQTNSAAGAAGFFKGTLGAGNTARAGRSSAEDFVAKMVASGLAPAPTANLSAFLPQMLAGIYTRDCAAGNPLLLQFCSMTPDVDSYTIAIDPSHYPPPVPGVDSNPVTFIRRAYLRPRTRQDPSNQKKTNGADPRHMFAPSVIYY